MIAALLVVARTDGDQNARIPCRLLSSSNPRAEGLIVPINPDGKTSAPPIGPHTSGLPILHNPQGTRQEDNVT